MKVFLDTNVLVSAAATRGICADVLREVFAFHELFISKQVLSELRRVLQVKFGATQDVIDEFVWILEQDSVISEPVHIPIIKLKDKDDPAIVGAAVAGGAEVLVTGDKELLALDRIADLEIFSPRQFWEKLKA